MQCLHVYSQIQIYIPYGSGLGVWRAVEVDKHPASGSFACRNRLLPDVRAANQQQNQAMRIKWSSSAKVLCMRKMTSVKHDCACAKLHFPIFFINFFTIKMYYIELPELKIRLKYDSSIQHHWVEWRLITVSLPPVVL